MKGCLPSFAALVAVALLVFAGGTPAPESSFGSTAVVQLEPAAELPPLVVGAPPDLLSLHDGAVIPVSMSMPQPEPAPAKYTEPAKPVLAKKTATVAQQSYGSCGPGGCGQRRGLFGRRR